MFIANLPDGGILTLTMPDGTAVNVRLQLRHRGAPIRATVDAPQTVTIGHAPSDATVGKFHDAEGRACARKLERQGRRKAGPVS